jgi:hypothetical protein
LQRYINKYRNDLDDEVVQCSLMRLLEIGAFTRNPTEIAGITSDVKRLCQMFELERSKVDAPVPGSMRAVLMDLEDEIENNLEKTRANLGV